MNLKEEILKLKKEKNALILAHNYQLPEIQDIADLVGDSLELSRAAAERNAPMIIFCGVIFMAETAKVLSPNAKVLIPSNSAGCFLADTITAKDVQSLRERYPDAVFVAYVNTTADVKAEVDLCCTSANAVKVVNSIDRNKTVVFLPDRNLGNYVISQTKRNNIVLWEKGFCYVHEDISAAMVLEQKQNHPDAAVVAHPECKPEVLNLADAVASTSGMIRFAKNSQLKKFIICTEKEMVYRLKKDCPDKEFIPVTPKAVCNTMKQVTLENLYQALLKEIYEVKLPENIINRAKNSIIRMLEIS